MLTQCSECNNSSSDKASACPHCGAPLVPPSRDAATPPLIRPDDAAIGKDQDAAGTTNRGMQGSVPVAPARKLERPTHSGQGGGTSTHAGDELQGNIQDRPIQEYVSPTNLRGGPRGTERTRWGQDAPEAPQADPDQAVRDMRTLVGCGFVVVAVVVVFIGVVSYNTWRISTLMRDADAAAQQNSWAPAVAGYAEAAQRAKQSWDFLDEADVRSRLAAVQTSKRAFDTRQALRRGDWAEAARVAGDASLTARYTRMHRLSDLALASCTAEEVAALRANGPLPWHLQGMEVDEGAGLTALIRDEARLAAARELAQRTQYQAVQEHQGREPRRPNLPEARQIFGDIISDDGQIIQIWGQAMPSFRERGNEAGVAIEPMSIGITNPDRSRIFGRRYQGEHFFVKTVHGKNGYGHVVPAHVYGPMPKDAQQRLTEWQDERERWRAEADDIARWTTEWVRAHGFAVLFGGTPPAAQHQDVERSARAVGPMLAMVNAIRAAFPVLTQKGDVLYLPSGSIDFSKVYIASEPRRPGDDVTMGAWEAEGVDSGLYDVRVIGRSSTDPHLALNAVDFAL